MDHYLESLPDGLDSHPTYLQKASVFRQFLELSSDDRAVYRGTWR